jgi:hypothetical protein
VKVLINYANDVYRKAQIWNSWTGKHIAGFDKIYEFRPEDIDPSYYEKHKDILSVKRGNGLWLWKPYFIDKVLSESKDGDIIFYADSGSFFVKKIDKLISSLRKNEKIWVSDCPLFESCFTKPSCMKEMKSDSETIKNSNQIQATYLMLICCEESRLFIREWLKYCENYELISPKGGLDLTENKGRKFVAHREDQSILSLLCKKKGILAHKDPSQRGMWPETFYNKYYDYSVPEHENDHYGTVLFLHKAKKPSILICIKSILGVIRSKYRYRKARG